MAAPAFQAIGTAVTSTGAALSVAWPTHLTDDVALLVVETSGDSSTMADPTGWANVTGSPNVELATIAGSKVYAFWKRAASAAEGNAATGAQTDHQLGMITTYRGCRTSGSPIDVSASAIKTVASLTATCPTATQLTVDCRIVLIASRPNDSAAVNHFGALTNAAITGLTERGEAGTIDGNGGGFVVADGSKATAGVIGTTTIAKGSSTTDVTFTIALASVNGTSPQNLGSQVATLTLTAVPGSLTKGNANLGSQVAALTLTAVPGALAGAASLPSQTALLALTAVPGSIVAARSLPAQVATLTLTAVPGSLTTGPAILPSQVATLTLTAVPSTAQGAAILGAQTALLTLTAIPSTVTPGPANLPSQRAALTLTAVPGTLAAGGVNLPSQTAILTLTAVPSTVVAVGGPQNLGSQTATLTLTAVPGVLAAAASLGSQVATITLTAIPGNVVAGATSLPSQVALLTLTATPGTVLTVGPAQDLPSQVALLTLTAVAGQVVTGVLPPPEPPIGTGTGARGVRQVRSTSRPYHPPTPKRMRVEYDADGTMHLLEVDAKPDALIVQPLPPLPLEPVAVVEVVEVATIGMSDDDLLLSLC